MQQISIHSNTTTTVPPCGMEIRESDASSGATVSRGLEISLHGRFADAIEFLQPLPITVSVTGDGYLTADSVFYMYGTGRTIVDSVSDYTSVLLEYYDNLLESQNEATIALREYLQTYIKPLS